MEWNYAKLSKQAKKLGGPENLVKKLFDSGRNKGRLEVIFLVYLISASAFAIHSIPKLIKKIKMKKEISRKEVDAIKIEIIQGIKDYDEMHEEDNKNLEQKENCDYDKI